MNIGERIKTRREELGMSVESLANKVGKSRATIYRYENGDIEKLPTDMLLPFTKALSTTPQYLMGWTDDPKAAPKEDVDETKMKIMTIYGKLSFEFKKKLLDRAEELEQMQKYVSYVDYIRDVTGQE